MVTCFIFANELLIKGSEQRSASKAADGWRWPKEAGPKVMICSINWQDMHRLSGSRGSAVRNCANFQQQLYWVHNEMNDDVSSWFQVSLSTSAAN